MTRQQTTYAAVGIAVLAVIVGILWFANRGPDSSALTDRPWHLVEISGRTPEYEGSIPAEDQGRYAIEFVADGSFTARADCNTVLGSYTLSGSDGITITPGPSTLVACPEGSYGSLFANALGAVTTWTITNDRLGLTTADGGSGTFVVGDALTTPTPAPVPSASASESASPSPTPSPSPSPTPTASPSPTPSPTPSPSPSPTPTASAAPSETPAPTATAAPTEAPTASPSPEPTPTPAPTPTPTPEPTAPPAPGADLIGTSWRLATLTTRDPVSSVVVPVDQRSKYTVAFAAGGTFSATADCNTVTGTWVATASGGLTITPGPSTIIACPDGSYGDLYILALTNSASYVIATPTMTMTLTDGGTLGFEAAP